jgi:aspartyl protease family protein
VFKTLLGAGAIVAAAAVAATGLNTSLLAPQPPLAKSVETPGGEDDDRSGVVTLRADPDGHFRVDATIGGRRVPMLVDTGATVVALSYEQGQALGLISGGDRFDSRVTTANGQIGAKRVVLRDVRIGSVRVPDVSALVLTQGAMDGALLGMSFLGRLRRMESSRDKLVLER